MKKRFYRKDWFLPACIVLAALLISGGVIFYKQNSASDNSGQAQNSKFFIYECDQSNPESIDCQQKKYVESVNDKGFSETFKVLRSDYESSNSVRANCHQITHAIGREAAVKFKTIEAAYERGDNFCWSGFYHGVMEAVAKDYGREGINNNLESICSKSASERKYSFYHFNCVHGLGHGLMAVNGDELFDVLKLCDKYRDDWEKRSCYGGAYMENIMNAIQMGGESKYLKNDEPMYPCTAVDDRYKQECYLMQTSQALRVLNYDHEKVFQLCADSGEYSKVCYQSLGRDASGNSTSNIEQTVAVCMKGKDQPAKENCFIGAVKDFISYHHGDTEAKLLCNALQPNLQFVCNITREEYVRTL